MRKGLIFVLAGTATAAAAITIHGAGAINDRGIITVVRGAVPAMASLASLAKIDDTGRIAVSTNGQCRTASTYYPWGRSAERTWTPRRSTPLDNPADDIGAAYGEPFSARLIQAHGEDLGAFRRTGIFEMADGCRRQFRINSLSASDEAFIIAQIEARPFPSDTSTYERRLIPDVTTQERLTNGELGNYTTQHFSFWYGTKTGSASYRWLRENNTDMNAHLVKTGAFFERLWLANRDILKAPMPYEGSARKLKLDIFICGTGLPWYGEADEVQAACGPSADEAMQAPIDAIQPGSDTATHELSHMLQFFSGGFRGRSGPSWEAGAEWNRFALNPVWGGAAYTYLSNLENGPLFSHYRYGAYPFLTYLGEKDATRDLYWRAWRENLRDANGASREDLVEALVRIGQDSGIYPEGYKSFADDVGWFGAQLVAMDFLNQRTMIDAHLGVDRRSWIPHFYTPLSTVATVKDPTIFASPAQRPLMQWGTHLIPLSGNGAGGKVSVTLAGGTRANQAAWRFALVAVGANDVPYYSSLGRTQGTGSNTVSLTPPVGTKLFLAVTATPYSYESLPWQPQGAPVGTKFPYRVQIVGATPFVGSPMPCNPGSMPGAWHINYNTNGFIEDGRPC